MSRNLVPHVISARFAIGSLLWAGVAAPALAAGFDVVALDSTFPLSEALLYGSLTLLAVAVVLRFSRRRNDVDATPPAPDLRWWKHQDA